jgi:hypothetical protein
VLESASKPEYSGLIDSVAAAVDLPPLHASALPDGYQELRVWTGFGLFQPHAFVRLVTGHGEVTGEKYLWFSPGDSDPEAIGNHEWMRRHHRCTGSVPVAGSAYEVCRVEFSEDYDWGRVLDSLAARDVWSLANQEPEKLGNDGWSLVVEARTEAGTYHTYHYWAPEAADGPSGEKADAIFRYALELRPYLHPDGDGKAGLRGPVSCPEETPYARRLIEQAIRYLSEAHSHYRRLRLDVHVDRPIEDSTTCSRIGHAGYHRTGEYSWLPFALPEGYIVFEVGTAGGIAEGCIELDFLTKDFVHTGGYSTLCFGPGDP